MVPLARRSICVPYGDRFVELIGCQLEIVDKFLADEVARCATVYEDTNGV